MRFFQCQGYDTEAAVSSGAIATTVSWTATGLLFLVHLSFAAGNFQAPATSGGRQTAVWIGLAVVLVAGIAAALIALVPWLRQLASSQVRAAPGDYVGQRQNHRHPTTQDRLHRTGSVLAQLLVALALGASLHALVPGDVVLVEAMAAPRDGRRRDGQRE